MIFIPELKKSSFEQCGDNLSSAFEVPAIEKKTASAELEALGLAQLPVPLSITHRHLLSCVKTWIDNVGRASNVIRVLDVGCGDGLLVKYLVETLQYSHRGQSIEVYGMDVHDHGVQMPGYWANTLSLLARSFPSVDWQKRLHLVSIADPWPFEDQFFDIVISNQVLEHVGDHNHFFSQHKRVLVGDGVGFHLFPLHHCIIEPHLKLPFVHWVSRRDLRARGIAFATKIGFGKFSGSRDDLHNYAVTHADYLSQQVNYKSQREISLMSLEAGLRPSFSKTHFYYTQKLRAVLGRPFFESYEPAGEITGNALAFLLRYISSVTLELRPGGSTAADTGSNIPSRPHQT